MRAATVTLLARPAVAEERRRVTLIAVSMAGAGALLLAGARVARMRGEKPDGSLAPWIAESGLRFGTVIAAALLTLPVLILALQALRVGSVARDRRMAALRLAGATPRDVRAVAATQAGAAAFTGGLLALGGYIVLWLAIGALPPPRLRLLPEPDAADVLVWVGVMVLAALGGAFAGAAVERRAIAEPLGVFRRTRTKPPGWWSRGIVALACIAVLVTLTRPLAASDVYIPILLVGVLVAAVAGGSLLVWRSGSRLTKRGDGVAILAGWRLRADPRSPGRVAGILVICGVALGIEAQELPYAFGYGETDLFFLTGTGLAMAVTVVACAVAVLTLLVGAADQLVDARRPLATLSALGIEQHMLERVLARQLTATAVPAVVVGVLAAVLLQLPDIEYASLGELAIAGALVLATAGLVALAVRLAARLSVRLLRRRLVEAIAPENLRAA